MGKEFHPILYWASGYLSMLRLKLSMLVKWTPRVVPNAWYQYIVDEIFLSGHESAQINCEAYNDTNRNIKLSTKLIETANAPPKVESKKAK